MPLEFDLDAIDTEELTKLMDVLSRSDVEECEIEQGDSRLVLKRGYGTAVPAGESGSAEPEGLRIETTVDGEDDMMVKAPAVGIFYRSEKRSAPPRVEPGARIKVGDILGYIEVLRIPHSVASTEEGVLESFLVEDGQPVEYGQPIVSLRA